MIFEIADGGRRRNSATAEGRCPTFTAFKRFGIVPESCLVLLADSIALATAVHSGGIRRGATVETRRLCESIKTVLNSSARPALLLRAYVFLMEHFPRFRNSGNVRYIAIADF